MSKLISYIKYLLKAKHRRGFGIHSPYLFRLQTMVVEEELPYYHYIGIEKVRKKFLASDKNCEVVTRKGGTNMSLSKATSRMAIDARVGQLAFRLVNDFKPKSIVEYGSTIGISSLYLAGPDSRTMLHSLSAQPSFVSIIKQYAAKLKIDNIDYISQCDMETFEQVLSKNPEVDFLMITKSEAEETKHLINKFFMRNVPKQMALVIDPHKDKLTESVWNEVKSMSQIKVTMDMFELGVIIKNPDLQKEDFVVRF